MSDLPEPGISAVAEQHFKTLSREKLPHQRIEDQLMQIGGGGVGGIKFKEETLQAAGWNGGKLTTYASRATKAALAFNRVREALSETVDRDDLLARVKALSAETATPSK
ncbi:MAG: hypothetical protein WCP34_06260 [Pseudomonadota bacterium]